MRCLFCVAVVIGVTAAGVVDGADPAAVRHQPTATCLTPVPAHVTLRSPETEVRAVLAAWEAAAATVEPVGKSERQRLAYLLRDAYSAHELALASEFREAIDSEELWRRYAWSRSNRGDGVMRLSAEPREAAEALFVPRFTLEFDDGSGLPRAIEFSRRPVRRVGARVASAAARIELDPAPQTIHGAPARKPKLIQTVSHATAGEDRHVGRDEPRRLVPPPPAEPASFRRAP